MDWKEKIRCSRSSRRYVLDLGGEPTEAAHREHPHAGRADQLQRAVEVAVDEAVHLHAVQLAQEGHEPR